MKLHSYWGNFMRAHSASAQRAKKRVSWAPLLSEASSINKFSFIASLTIHFINTVWLHYNIISAAAFFFSFYFISSIYLNRIIWKRLGWLLGIITLTLPFSYHLQTFLGFPIRLFTAKIVSALFNLFGIGSFTDSSVIITENNATSIDLPCSGIKSLYTGAILMLLIYFVKNARFSLKLCGISLAFMGSLLIMNIWRVFSLTFIYDVLELKQLGDVIHIALGVTGFSLSFILLWILSEKYSSAASLHFTRPPLFIKNPKTQLSLNYLLSLVSIFLVIDLYLSYAAISYPQPIPSLKASSFNNPVSIGEIVLKEDDFTPKEKNFFAGKEVLLSKKYTGELSYADLKGLPFNLLIIKSKSWRTHHNPELCLQGLGHKIEKSELFHLAGINVRKLTLNNHTGSAFYWFTDGAKTLADFSDRVWEGILRKNTPWTLIVIGFNQNIEVQNQNLKEFIFTLNEGFHES